jgi:hypothetical protein
MVRQQMSPKSCRLTIRICTRMFPGIESAPPLLRPPSRKAAYLKLAPMSGSAFYEWNVERQESGKE